MTTNLYIPKELKELFDSSKMKQNQMGLSGDGIYFIQEDRLGRSGYLKISSNQEIENEVAMYQSLLGFFLVPEVYYFKKEDHLYYLYMSEIKGKVAFELFEELGYEEVSRIYGSSLRKLHNLKMIDTIPNYPLSNRLQQAKENVDKDLVDESDFQDENLGKSAIQLYNEMIEMKPSKEELVITHGDYCMPNLLISNGKLSGFIDMGRGGVSDRYQDIALAIRSLRYNLDMIDETKKEQCQKAFLEGYGIDYVDEDKIKFYILLDEFF